MFPKGTFSTETKSITIAASDSTITSTIKFSGEIIGVINYSAGASRTASLSCSENVLTIVTTAYSLHSYNISVTCYIK